jgi:hypothetical protein
MLCTVCPVSRRFTLGIFYWPNTRYKTPPFTILGTHDVIVNIFNQELWALWGWRMYSAETCRSGINILYILFNSHMNFVGFDWLTNQDSPWHTQNSDRCLWNTTVVCYIGLLHQPIWWFCCWMGDIIIWTFYFSDWRLSSDNWSHSQKPSLALPVQHIMHPMFMSKCYRERHFKVLYTLPDPVSLKPSVGRHTSTVLIWLDFCKYVYKNKHNVAMWLWYDAFFYVKA